MEGISALGEILGMLLFICLGILGLILVLYGIYSFSEPKFTKSVRNFCLISGGLLMSLAFVYLL